MDINLPYTILLQLCSGETLFLDQAIMATSSPPSPSIPVLDLSQSSSSAHRHTLLFQLQEALFHTGFLYIINHGVKQSTIDDLINKLPAIFDLPTNVKNEFSKRNSPHFLGYSGFAEEITLGKKDLREQWDFGSDVPVIWNGENSGPDAKSAAKNYNELYWRLRGPNQWPPEERVPGFRQAYMKSATTKLCGLLA